MDDATTDKGALKLEQRLGDILDAVTIGIAVVDAAGQVIEINKAMRKIWGGSAPLPENFEKWAQYKGWWSDTGEPLKLEDWPHARVLKTGEPVSEQAIDIERADGTCGNILTSGVPLRDEQGHIVGVIISVQDVTRYVKLRLALERSLEAVRQEKAELNHSREETQGALDRELQSSQLLQSALLPEKPMVGPGYSVAHTYAAGIAAAGIGGDFYDTFSTESGKVGILIGDVSGKGLEAAAFAAATRSTVRAFAYETASPGESLAHTNDVLVSQSQTFGVFVTVFLIILDPSTGEFRYSSAGHPPSAIYRMDGDVEFLDIHSPILGVWGKLAYHEGSGQLRPGDKIVLYTDGISEARHNSELFGTERLEEVLGRHGTESPDSLVSELFTAANTWAKGNITDDVAVLIVERAAAIHTLSGATL